MEQTTTVKGYFYLPDNPADQLPGMLTYSQVEGINLDLFGHFNPPKDSSKYENDLILGVTSNGKKITLLNCYEYSRKMNFPGFPESKINSIYLLIGAHFDKKESISFNHCIIEYEDFNHWIDVSGFSMPKHNPENQEVLLKYKQPDRINFNLKRNWTASIEFNYSYPYEFFIPIQKAAIEQYACLKLKPDNEASLSEFQEVFSTFNSLLAMSYFTFPIIKSINFFSTTNTNAKESFEGDQQSKSELFFKTGIDQEKYKKHDDPHSFLLQYKDFGSGFEQKIKNWYLLNEKAETSLNILTECFMNRITSTELHFISLTQALENFHRRIKLKKKVPFRSRLRDLILLLPNKVRLELFENYDNFLDRIELNRNYYTHYSEDQEKKAGSLNELFELSEKMKIFLTATVLLEIGFTNDEVERIILDKGVWLFNHIIIKRRS